MKRQTQIDGHERGARSRYLAAHGCVTTSAYRQGWNAVDGHGFNPYCSGDLAEQWREGYRARQQKAMVQHGNH